MQRAEIKEPSLAEMGISARLDSLFLTVVRNYSTEVYSISIFLTVINLQCILRKIIA